MRWLGWALAASGVEVELALAWRGAAGLARRLAGLLARLRGAGADFLDLGRATGVKEALIRAAKVPTLQCETLRFATSRGRRRARA